MAGVRFVLSGDCINLVLAAPTALLDPGFRGLLCFFVGLLRFSQGGEIFADVGDFILGEFRLFSNREDKMYASWRSRA